MEKVYKALLNNSERKFIAEEMGTMVRLNRCNDEQETYNMNSFGIKNLPSTTCYIKRFTNILQKDYGNLKFVNTYTRLHRNGAALPCHTDKKILQVTLSVCVYNNTGVDWKLHISKESFEETEIGIQENEFVNLHKIKSNSKSYITPIGVGVACKGSVNPHWRDTLVCQENSVIVQTFYHWQFDD